MPFKKVFEPATPKGEEPSLAIGHPLSDLVDAIDTQHEIRTEKVVEKAQEHPREQPIPRAPFNGEKPLSQTIPPVKFAERGPTESSRNLLKEALLKATQPTSSQEKKEPLEKKNNRIEKQETGPQEISHQELQKILE
jgi:hypothetical protein